MLNSCKKEIGDCRSQQNEIYELSQIYGYHISKNIENRNQLKLRNLNELGYILFKLNSCHDSIYVIDKDGNKLHQNIKIIQVSIIDSGFKLLKKISNTKSIKKNSIEDATDPIQGSVNFKYSKMFYFNNQYPSPNYFARIDYNTDGNGNFTNAQISTGSWGSYISGTYSQTGSNVYFKNGSLAFQVNGSQGNSFGIGNYTLFNNVGIQFLGYFQLIGVYNTHESDYGKLITATVLQQRPLEP